MGEKFVTRHQSVALSTPSPADYNVIESTVNSTKGGQGGFSGAKYRFGSSKRGNINAKTSIHYPGPHEYSPSTI
jgi:hypothetical protein